MFKRTALMICCFFSFNAHAEGIGVYVNGGTTGFGLGVSGGSEKVTGRLGFDTYKRSFTQNDSNGNYNVDLKLQTVAAMADWYPFEGAFRATMGLVVNGNKASLTASSVGGTFTFNGQSYQASDVGSYSGEMTFNKTVPYLGIGWGNPSAKNKTWGFVSDIGILFQGSPKVSNTVNCGAVIQGTAACTQLQNDVASAATQLETDLKDFKYYPVLSVGLSYRF